MQTVRQICAVAFLTAAFSTSAFGEGWIGTGHKPPYTTNAAPASQNTPTLDITGTGEESSYFDEMYEATLLFIQMNLL